MVGLRPCGCWQELMGLRQIISEFDDTGVERLALTEGRLSQVVADYRFFCCDPLRAHGTSTCRLHDQVVACGGAQFPGMRACPDNQPLAVQETISEEIVRSLLTSVRVGGKQQAQDLRGFSSRTPTRRESILWFGGSAFGRVQWESVSAAWGINLFQSSLASE